MTKEEFFENNMEKIINNRSTLLCFNIPCEECFYARADGCMLDDFPRDFKSFQRKKKLEKLLS